LDVEVVEFIAIPAPEEEVGEGSNPCITDSVVSSKVSEESEFIGKRDTRCEELTEELNTVS